jgi:spore coat polysaccharide biosynthesis protein SpsF
MRIAAIIEARMTSIRLPGKHMLPAAGQPMIACLVNRLKRVVSLTDIVMATTIKRTDDPLVELSEELGITYFRGSEEDVMGRVLGAADSVKSDVIVSITGDCPLIDPDLVEQCIRVFLNNKCDYLNNAETPSYPEGMNTQVYRIETLRKAFALTDDPLDHEHVTLYIRKHPELFYPLWLVAPPSLYWPELQLTLDEPSDYEFLKLIIEYFAPFNPNFTCEDIIRLIRKNPQWLELNRNVKRRGDE